MVDRNLGVHRHIDTEMTVGETAEDNLNKHTAENENLHHYLLYIFLS